MLSKPSYTYGRRFSNINTDSLLFLTDKLENLKTLGERLYLQIFVYKRSLMGSKHMPKELTPWKETMSKAQKQGHWTGLELR